MKFTSPTLVCIGAIGCWFSCVALVSTIWLKAVYLRLLIDCLFISWVALIPSLPFNDLEKTLYHYLSLDYIHEENAWSFTVSNEIVAATVSVASITTAHEGIVSAIPLLLLYGVLTKLALYCMQERDREKQQ